MNRDPADIDAKKSIGDETSPPDVGEPASITPLHADRPEAALPDRRRWRALYPNIYVWFIFLAALDAILTALILHPVLYAGNLEMTESRGGEANSIAAWIIEHGDVPGMVAFKFVLVTLVIIICEIIGRRRADVGRRLAEWAVAITTIPVAVALYQMGRDVFYWFYPPH